MNAFEILFILLFLASVLILAIAAGYALFGRRANAIGILRRYAIILTVYFAIVIVASFGTPRKELAIGESLCFDDWCITIRGVEMIKNQAGDAYVVTARLSSRARRAPQRENGIVLYLTDRTGSRYDAEHSGSDLPFNVQLSPNQNVDVTRTFRLPSGIAPLGVVVAHEGGFPITWFIIGEGPFKEPPIVLLSDAVDVSL